VAARLIVAATDAPPPTPRTSLAGMMHDVANAGMSSVVDVNMLSELTGYRQT
jgi:hypothetical protein